MAVHHRRKIVQTVGQCQGLWIGHVLPHLLDTTVNITEVWIDALHGLTINNSLQSEHTVGRWVVRTDVDNIVVLIKATLLCSNEMSILAQGILHGEVILWLIGARELVCLRTHIEVLAQWIALEIGADALLLAKNIDYLYTDDPRTNPDAKKIEETSYSEIVDKRLHAIDLTTPHNVS